MLGGRGGNGGGFVRKCLGLLACTGWQMGDNGRETFAPQTMSEEQLKAAETETMAQVEEGVEEISEEDLEGVAGGAGFGIAHFPANTENLNTFGAKVG